MVRAAALVLLDVPCPLFLVPAQLHEVVRPVAVEPRDRIAGPGYELLPRFELSRFSFVQARA